MVEQLIEHEILVDKYITVKLAIPKQLDAVSLKGLMTKANRLFSLSEIELQSVSAPKTKLYTRHTWTASETEFLAEMVKVKKPVKEIVKLFGDRFKSGIPAQKIEARYYGLKRDGK